MNRDPEVVALMDKLAEPFPANKIKWRAGATNREKTQAMALAYIDARVVQERLDDVLGPENWQSAFEVLGSGAVVCSLSIRIKGEWIKKTDAGGESEQDDQGDRTKAAFSDSLKRAAVQFGIGRFLYSLPKQWVAYDANKKQLASTPKLPANFAKGGGNPPPDNSRSGNTGNSRSVNTASKDESKAKTAPEGGKAPAASSQQQGGPPKAASSEQIDRIDAALKTLEKDVAWLTNALNDRFGKTLPAELTFDEAEQVITGLDKKIEQIKPKLVDGNQTASNTVGSKGSAPAKSAGKTPPRRGTF